jgi:hypothetical protein
MQRTRRANILGGLTRIVSEIQMSVNKKFQDFYLKCLLQFGLVTRTFSYEFAIGNNGSGAHRKSLNKLSGLITKQLLKLNPVANFVTGSFIDSKLVDQFRINIGDTGWVKEYPSWRRDKFERMKTRLPDVYGTSEINHISLVHGTSFVELWARLSDRFGWAYRYCSYLNYMFRKHSVPLYASVGFSADSDSTVDENGVRVALYKIKATINFATMQWRCRDSNSAARYREVLNGAEDDALFSDGNLWTLVNLPNSIRPGSSNFIYRKFHISKVFMHLDKSLKISETLLRKVDYGIGAYTLRAE